MDEIVINQHFNAPPEIVFRALSKHATLNTIFWPVQTQRYVDAEDADNPDGVGSVRRMGLGPIKPIQEKITRMETNRVIEYKLINNPLVSHHLGRLSFSEANGGTNVVYTIALQSRLPLVADAVLLQLKLAATLGMKRLAGKLHDTSH